MLTILFTENMQTDQPLGDLTKVTPPTELTEPELDAFFQYFMRKLASHRNNAEMYAMNELVSSSKDNLKGIQV